MEGGANPANIPTVTTTKNFSEADKKYFLRRASQTPRPKGHGKLIFTEVVEVPASVNQTKKTKKKPMDRPAEPIHGPPLPLPARSGCRRRRYRGSKHR
jgi:hypothetical protein